METVRTPKKRKLFLETLADTCNVRDSCKAAGIARNSVYLWRKADAKFAKEWEEALDLGADALEDEAVRRGRDGVDEPVFYKGEMCGTVRKYSDTLLIFLLKGARPKKYGEHKQVEHSGRVTLEQLITSSDE